MFDSLVITLREGVEAALIVGIVLGYLKKAGRSEWTRYVWWGVGAAVAVSAAAAYFLEKLAISEDAYEGWMMLVGAVFVASVVVWMMRASRGLKKEIESRISDISIKPTRSGAWGIFAFVLLMVSREGAETAIFLGAVSLRTTELMNLMGAVLGLALAIGLGVAFFKGSLKVNLRRFFSITSLVLLVVAVQLLVSGLHELSESRVIPSSRSEMAIIGPIVNSDVFFFVAVIALCLFLVLAQKIRSGSAAEVDLARMPAPERRKVLAGQQRERFWKLAASSVGLIVIVLISGDFVYSRVARAVKPPVQLTFTSDSVVEAPVDQLKDHKLHTYQVAAGGKEVRFIAIIDSSDTVRVGLDACQICGDQGYYQQGQNVICRLCGSAIYVPTIGSAGGCNPIHIDYLVQNNMLVISRANLAQAARYFH
ncbi:MAG TPA: Fe-S-containing protein [Terriglobia bacterium]|nr:Fe-S-containing protein [Terriglobia bacterium]